MPSEPRLSFNVADVSQIVIGAFALAVPVSFSEEAWLLGESLPGLNILLIFCLSLSFLSLYAYQVLFQADIKKRYGVFVFRILIAYLITGLIVGLVLLAFDKLPLLTTPLIALKRMIVITLPASMGAIVVDSIDKE